MDLDARHSMARWFAARGREAWTVSLRPNGAYFGPGGGTAPLAKPGYDLDALVDQDISTAVAYVRGASKAPLIDYVGHSLGGIVLYGYLGMGGQGIGAAAVLGSPMRLDLGGPVDAVLPAAAGLLDPSWILPVRGPSSLTIPLAGLLQDSPGELLLYNPENTPHVLFQRLMAETTEDVSVGLLRQLAEMLRTGELKRHDGSRDYRKLLAAVTTPVLVVAGKRDRLATVPAVKAGYLALGGPKEWRLVGVETGARADYGHMDLAIGDRAAEEVWPDVLGFFDRHAR
jgi:pimeloyl-ACP methyl ester carboxylesterase